MWNIYQQFLNSSQQKSLMKHKVSADKKDNKIWFASDDATYPMFLYYVSAASYTWVFWYYQLWWIILIIDLNSCGKLSKALFFDLQKSCFFVMVWEIVREMYRFLIIFTPRVHQKVSFKVWHYGKIAAFLCHLKLHSTLERLVVFATHVASCGWKHFLIHRLGPAEVKTWPSALVQQPV